MNRSILRLLLCFLVCTVICVAVVPGQSESYGYPDVSNPPWSLAKFKNNELVAGISPSSGSFVDLGAGESIKLWYSGSHAMTLGLREIIIKEGRSKTTIDCAVTNMSLGVVSADALQTGCAASSDDVSGTDREGRPVSPVLFITDVTLDPSSRTGDWQQGGVGIPPNRVYGTWKAAVKKIDRNKTNDNIHLDSDRDPEKNHWILGDGSDLPPAGTPDKGFGSECVWSVDNLGLLEGHSYRLQFIVHGGEMERAWSNAGMDISTVTVAPALNNCTINPQNTTITEGDSVIFSAAPSGGVAPFSYLWSTGETGSYITARTAGPYTVTIFDALNRFTQCQATLFVTPGAAFPHGPSAESAGPLPIKYKLGQNYPNPFNPETSVPFDLPEESMVRITVYNLLGQMVATLIDEQIEAGYRTLVWNTENNHLMPISSGFYLCRIQARSLVSGKDFSGVRKMLFLQ